MAGVTVWKVELLSLSATLVTSPELTTRLRRPLLASSLWRQTCVCSGGCRSAFPSDLAHVNGIPGGRQHLSVSDEEQVPWHRGRAAESLSHTHRHSDNRRHFDGIPTSHDSFYFAAVMYLDICINYTARLPGFDAFNMKSTSSSHMIKQWGGLSQQTFELHLVWEKHLSIVLLAMPFCFHGVSVSYMDH